jgi:hypothetical protein
LSSSLSNLDVCARLYSPKGDKSFSLAHGQYSIDDMEIRVGK